MQELILTVLRTTNMLTNTEVKKSIFIWVSFLFEWQNSTEKNNSESREDETEDSKLMEQHETSSPRFSSNYSLHNTLNVKFPKPTVQTGHFEASKALSIVRRSSYQARTYNSKSPPQKAAIFYLFC